MRPPERNLYRDRQPATFVLAFFIAAIYAAAICGNGIPALRHDWWWPVNASGSYDSLINLSSGWISNGIGYPAPFPGYYMIGPLVAALGLAAGPLVALALFGFAIGLACALAARWLAIALGANPITTAALQIFAVFNPWVYSKTVSGHTFMILAYAGLIAIVAESGKREINPVRLSLLVLLTLPQLQFFLIAVVLLVIVAAVKKIYLPIVTAVVAGSPLIVGFVMERSQLLQTPYTVLWQVSQSIPVSQAPVFLGYFADYTSHFGALQIAALWCVVALAAAAVFLSSDRLRAIAIAAATAFLLLLATGVSGPFAAPYIWIVRNVPQSGLFRELYDLLGLVAIGYLALLALPMRRWAHSYAVLTLIAVIGAASAWIAYPPFAYWVNSATMPVVNVEAPPNTRFALLPPFQPMSYRNAGSGMDRDTYRRSGNVTALNEYLASYPVDVALAKYAATGDAGDLEALSVSVIVRRSWLQSNVIALREQLAGVPKALAPRSSGRVSLDPLPELTIGPMPSIGSLDNELGAGNVLFSDAGIAPIYPLVPSNEFVQASQGWVSATFAFVDHPEYGQGIGGVFTTNARRPLSVQPDLDTLVNVIGRLRAPNGKTIAGNTNGYRWTLVPSDTNELYCEGRCVVVAQAHLPPRLPLNPPRKPWIAQPFAAIFPFFVRADVGTGRSGLLRYNVRYDPQWVAYEGMHTLSHLRIDATVNGWIVPRANRNRTVWLVQRTAFLQFLCECVGALWVFGLAGYALRPRRFSSMTRS